MAEKEIIKDRIIGFSEAVIDETSGVVRPDVASTVLLNSDLVTVQTSIANNETVVLGATLPLGYTYANWPESLAVVANDTYIYNAAEIAWLEFSDKNPIPANDIFFQEKTWIRADLSYQRTNSSTGQIIAFTLRNQNPASSLFTNPIFDPKILPQGSDFDTGRVTYIFPLTMDALSHSTNPIGGGYQIQFTHQGNGLINCQARVEIFR